MQRLCNERLNGLPREVAIDRLRPAQKIFRIDQTRVDECIRECRLVSAQTVARRPWKRTHALGAELHLRSLRAMDRLDDAAATERNRSEVRQRELQRITEQV